MTSREYLARKRKLQKSSTVQMLKNSLAIRAVYRKQVKHILPMLGKLPAAPLSANNIAKIKSKIDRETLYKEIDAILEDASKAQVRRSYKIDIEYMMYAFNQTGVKIQEEKLIGMYERKLARTVKHNEYTPVIITNKVSFKLSESVWDAIDDFSDKILAFIQAEREAGTDPNLIARHLEEYLASGAEAGISRWGKLIPGTSEYRKRLGKAGADYRTQRIVRTEMMRAIRDTNIENGSLNVGCEKVFDWRLSPSHVDWDCDCPSHARNGPYGEQEIQSMSDNIHTNCRCLISARLKDHDTLMQELKDYVNGVDSFSTREIEKWASVNGLD